MRKNIPTMMPDRIYQVFNRGVNCETLFKRPAHYFSFLQKIARFLLPVADLYAYCMMKEHFRLCLRTHSEGTIYSNLGLEKAEVENSSKTCSWYISNQFSSLFKSYALSINNAFNRTGGLFEEPFRRNEIFDDTELCWLIRFIHSNPKIHHHLEDFTRYPHSSFSSLISTNETILNRALVLSAFGGRDQFLDFHQQPIPFDVLHRFSLE